MRAEIFHALFWLFVGIVTTFSSTRYSLGSFSDPGPGALPFLLGVVFILLALIYRWYGLGRIFQHHHRAALAPVGTIGRRFA